MRNFLLLLLMILAGFGVHYIYGWSQPAMPVAEVAETPQFPQAPDFTFTQLDGTTQQLNSLRGKTVLLNFWASWCAPCRVEFPQFIALAQARADVVILAVSVDHDKQAMQKFLRELGPELKRNNIIIAHDPEKKIAQDLFQTIRYPETILIGPDGTLRRKYIGLEVKWDSETFMQTLPAALR